MLRNVVSIDAFEDVPADNEHALAKAVTSQPISVAICASSNLQFYAEGIVDQCCTELDHGVLAVGYGEVILAGSVSFTFIISRTI